MGYYRAIILFIILTTFKCGISYSQFTYNPKCRYTAVGFSLKASYFDGDIETPLQYVRPGLGVQINRRFMPRISMMAELMWLRVMGDDYSGSNLLTPNKIPYYIRNLHFRNDIKEISLSLKYDLFPSTDHYRKRPIYNLYGLIGISIFHHNPKARIYEDTTFSKRKWVALRKLETENKTYSPIQIAIPLGVGIRYKISLQWDMEVELGYRFTFTDYLDDVSGNYVDPSLLKSDLSRQMSNRSADPKSALSNGDRDLTKIEGDLGYSINNSSNYNYVENFGPGNSRGSKKGPDGIIIFNIRFLYALRGTVNCPKFREFE